MPRDLLLVSDGRSRWFESVRRHRLETDFWMVVEVQARGAVEVYRSCCQGMRHRRWGAILDVSSKGALHPAGPPYGAVTGGAVYGMVKAALERFTTGLAAEVHADNVHVNVLSPTSMVPTPGVVHHQLLTPEPRAPRRTGRGDGGGGAGAGHRPARSHRSDCLSQQLLWEPGWVPTRSTGYWSPSIPASAVHSSRSDRHRMPRSCTPASVQRGGRPRSRPESAARRCTAHRPSAPGRP